MPEIRKERFEYDDLHGILVDGEPFPEPEPEPEADNEEQEP